LPLPDGKEWEFRDLRLFCLAWDAVHRVCIVAVHPEGRRYVEESLFEILTRMEDVRA